MSAASKNESETVTVRHASGSNSYVPPGKRKSMDNAFEVTVQVLEYATALPVHAISSTVANWW